MEISLFRNYIDSNTEAAPLAAFRIFFGVLMLLSLVRFWYHGWIEKLYIDPPFHFHYYGFEWITVPGQWTYLLFVICGIAALGIIVGYKYRWSMIIFFLSFTYIELMDKTTYLNHYYFISVLSFLLIFLPAGRYFSLDARLQKEKAIQYIPRWNIDAIKLLVAIVYIYAGLAKLNPDWMIEAMPLKIWLPSKYDIPLLGDLLQKEWVHYAFSWGGALYDLAIVFFLMYKPTRMWAFAAVVIFHVLTGVLFPIGMFPYIMIGATLIFFDAAFHHRCLSILSRGLNIDKTYFDNKKSWSWKSMLREQFVLSFMSMFFIVQLIFPLRFLAYPGNLFWTEQGYRFSWRVMLMEKAGYANFKIQDAISRKRFYVQNDDFLTSFQEKQMSTQPDMILEYAHYLGHHFRSQGHENVQVFVESYVALNGRKSSPYIDPSIDLLQLSPSLQHKKWILPYND
jgi:hypothetical protein